MLCPPTISGSCSAKPFSQVTDKIEEEVTLRNTDDFVADHNEQGEPLGIGKAEPVGNCAAEIFGSRAGVNLKCLAHFVGEKHFVEDLGGFALYSVDFDKMRRVAPGASAVEG